MPRESPLEIQPYVIFRTSNPAQAATQLKKGSVFDPHKALETRKEKCLRGDPQDLEGIEYITIQY